MVSSDENEPTVLENDHVHFMALEFVFYLPNLIHVGAVIMKLHPSGRLSRQLRGIFTLLKQESIVTVHGVPMTDYMESLIKSTMALKAGQGRQAIEWVISRLKEETQDFSRAARIEMDGLKSFAPHKTSL